MIYVEKEIKLVLKVDTEDKVKAEKFVDMWANKTSLAEVCKMPNVEVTTKTYGKEVDDMACKGGKKPAPKKSGAKKSGSKKGGKKC